MVGKFDFSYQLSGRTVHNGYTRVRTISVADKDLICCGVVAGIVGIARNLNSLEKFVRAPIEHSDRSIIAIGHENMVGFRDVSHSLRFPQTADCGSDLVGTEIEHFKCIVAQGAHKQALALNVHVEMIDSAMHTRQRNGLDQAERRGLLRACDWSTEYQHENETRKSSPHHWCSGPSQGFVPSCTAIPGPHMPIAEHTHHAATSEGSECIACHMPNIEVTLGDNMVAAHTFRFISPELTKQFRIPNPCNTCHADKSADWTIDQLRTWQTVSPWRVLR